jgi:hypothetical protein
MSVGGSILIVVLGAVLRYAIHVHGGPINVGVVGMILMIAGVASLLLRLLFRPHANPDRPLYPSDIADTPPVETPPQPEVIVEDVPVVQHHYADDPDEPHVYSLTGNVVGSQRRVRFRNRNRNGLGG